MSASSLIFEIIGVDRASKTFEKISRGMEKAEDRSKKLKIAGGLALGALAVGAVEFGKKSVEKFGEVGGETLRLQRILGGTATEVSRLRFAAEESGVSADKLGVGFGILSKHLDANDKAWKSVGINAKDAHGKIRPMAELIPDIAEKFAKMPAGPHKTALAMKLFGRSGKELLPFLNKGKEGIKDLSKESDKFGNTLSEKDTAAVKHNIIAKRQLNAAVAGLEIQLGRHLVPALAAVVTFLTGTVLWFSHLSTGVKDAIGIAAALIGIVFLVVKATKAWTAVQAALNVVMDANPIVLIILGLAALVIGLVIAYKKFDTFRHIVNAVFGFVRDHWKLILGILTGPVGLAVTWIATHWDTVKGIFSGVKKFVGAAFKGLVGVLEAPFRTAFGWILGAIKGVKDAFIAVKNFVEGGSTAAAAKVAKTHAYSVGRGGGVPPARAGGGPVSRGGPYLVGENGPELFVPGQSGGIIPNAGTKQALTGGGGGSIQLVVNYIGGSTPAEQAKFGRFVEQSLQKLGRPVQVRTA